MVLNQNIHCTGTHTECAGHIYDEDKDVFNQVNPTQYPSFVYHDETGTWHPPTEKIVDGVTVPVEPPTHHQVWDEETISWVTK